MKFNDNILWIFIFRLQSKHLKSDIFMIGKICEKKIVRTKYVCEPNSFFFYYGLHVFSVKIMCLWEFFFFFASPKLISKRIFEKHCDNRRRLFGRFSSLFVMRIIFRWIIAFVSKWVFGYFIFGKWQSFKRTYELLTTAANTNKENMDFGVSDRIAYYGTNDVISVLKQFAHILPQLIRG